MDHLNVFGKPFICCPSPAMEYLLLSKTTLKLTSNLLQIDMSLMTRITMAVVT